MTDTPHTFDLCEEKHLVPRDPHCGICDEVEDHENHRLTEAA